MIDEEISTQPNGRHMIRGLKKYGRKLLRRKTFELSRYEQSKIYIMESRQVCEHNIKSQKDFPIKLHQWSTLKPTCLHQSWMCLLSNPRIPLKMHIFWMILSQ
ncbi:hypothetical protein Lal_00027996 [Lupinus albus]|nr:hypothetical protein Lal_00027996 [Lupinus albus]